MKKTIKLRTKALLRLFSFFIAIGGLSFPLFSAAQTNRGCVTGNFEFKVDGGHVLFEAKAKGPVVGYSWDFGDNTQGSGQNVRHQYNAPGTYKVCLTILGFDSAKKERCKYEVCRSVEIKKCNLNADFELKIDGNSIAVHAKSNSRNVVYGWDFGDGEHARGQSVRHKYAKFGVYELCMTAKDTVTGCVQRICRKVMLKDPCKPIPAEIVFKQNGNDFHFSVRSKKGNGIRTIWHFSDGDSAKGNTVRKSFDKPGVYTVCVTLFNPRNKCKTTICKRIEVKRKCNLEAAMDVKVDGNSIKAMGKASSKDVVFAWELGDGHSATGNPVDHKYAKPGVYELCMEAFDTVTKCRVRVCRKVEIKDPCRLKAEFKFKIDSNGVVYFYGHANDSNAQFVWDFGDNTNASGNPVKHQYKPGKYTICVTAYTSRNCSVRFCHTIVIPAGRNSKRQSAMEDPDTDGFAEAQGSELYHGIDWDENHVSISPNPVFHSATLSADDMEISRVSVYSSDGVKLMDLKVQAGQEMDLSSLPTGSYYLKIEDETGRIEHERFFKK